MISKFYQFGHTTIEIRMPQEIQEPQNMKIFEVPSCTVEKVFELQIEENLFPCVQRFQEENPEAKMIMRKNMRILVGAERECRILNFEGTSMVYGVYVEESPALVQVWVRRDMVSQLYVDTIFGSLLGLEKVMIQKNAMILHSAYVCRDGKAILFSAPSETGKSTQAGLWEKYRGTRQINGDRSLLLKNENGWCAYGWPICGSSEICHNESYPIQAIVMLYQSKTNEIRRLKMSEAMKKLISQITINMWNSEFQMKTIDLIQQLAMEVPIYEMGCDISEDAVRCLEGVL